MEREAIQAEAAVDTERGAEGDVVDRLVALLYELIPELRSESEARREELREVVRREFAGEQLYVTRRRPVVETRAEILRRFNGRNASEVARQLRISRATVYRLLKQPGGG